MTLFGPTADAMGIRDLYRRVSLAITRAMRGEVWVRAEIATLRERDRRCYLTLAEPARDSDESDAFLDVVVWRAPWARIRAQLDKRGLTLREGMTVSLRGEVCLRPERGRLQLRGSALDTDALLGELTARRMALRRVLAAEGLLDANARLPLSPVPLRVGLVASRHSQGYHDFGNVLAASGYAFVLTEKPVLVQGVAAPREVAAAIAALSGADVDVVVIVRGGGARGDLDAFDSELVARAIASAPVPVWTGVGHTGDRYLADEVASVAHATPTACAQALVARVAAFDLAVGQRIRRLQELAHRAVDRAQDEVVRRQHLLVLGAAARLDRRADALARQAHNAQLAASRTLAQAGADVVTSAGELLGAAAVGLDADIGHLRARAEALSRAGRQGLARRESQLEATAGRVRSAALRAVGGADRDVVAVRRVLTAYDPGRQLERGWTLTFDDHGVPVRRAGALQAGQRIVSRFVDGERSSVVEPASAP